MAPTPSTLLLDDGELGEVRAALEDVGVEYTYLRGGAVEGIDLEQPRELLVASARRALQLPRTGTRQGRPVRIAVAGEDSTTLRRMLRDAGFDYLVRLPIHPDALRALLLRALYRGPERRVSVRYPAGGEVAYRTGLRKRPATLIEISLRGCRLRAPDLLEPDARITVYLPKSLTGDRKLTLAGWVVRAGEAGGGGDCELAVAFETLPGSVERSLREILKERLAGVDSLVPAEQVGHDAERRAGPRGSFPQRVRAIQDRAERVLMGRNLSAGGMLVEQSLALRVGDEITLAIFAREREEPILVRAQALREDQDGVALRFVDVDPEDAGRLEGLVAGLPPVERLADGETESLGAVVAEIRSGKVL